MHLTFKKLKYYIFNAKVLFIQSLTYALTEYVNKTIIIVKILHPLI